MNNNIQYNLQEVLQVLKKGGTILYPTDTIWGIGCDATNEQAVKKIFHIKQRVQHKSLIILVDSLETLGKYVESVPPIALDLMQSIVDPLTIIYPRGRNLPPNVMADDQSIAIRIPKDTFCQTLLRAFGKPITSTSANMSGVQHPVFFSQISPEVIKAVDYVVKGSQVGINRPKASSIIRIDDDGDIQIIRN
jgi:L-threonylcarbamoyladenylate synthase